MWLPVLVDCGAGKAVRGSLVSAGHLSRRQQDVGDNAGVDHWAMVELVRKPKAMWRATAEVHEAFGARGVAAEHALGELRYLHLIIRRSGCAW